MPDAEKGLSPLAVETQCIGCGHPNPTGLHIAGCAEAQRKLREPIRFPSGPPPERRAIAREVAQFNDLIPVGTPVLYWAGLREGEGVASKTRTRAWLLGDHTPVVMVEGYPGGIALSHVCPIPPEEHRTFHCDRCGQPAMNIDANGLCRSCRPAVLPPAEGRA